MAVAYLDRLPVSRGKGQSVVAKAAYNACSNITAKDGEKDFSKKTGLAHQEIITSDGTPKDRGELWREVEATEKRKDAQLGYSYTVALPKELTKEQNIKLAQDFSTQILKRYGHAAIDLCIHYPVKRKSHANKDHENPHFHLLAPTRGKDNKKLRLFGDTQDLLEVRTLWQETCNRYLKEAGHPTISIDLRNVEERLTDCQSEIKQLEEQETQIKTELEAIQNERERANARATSPEAFWRYSQFKNSNQQPVGSAEKTKGQPSELPHSSERPIQEGPANDDRPNNGDTDGDPRRAWLEKCARLRAEFYSDAGLDPESGGARGESLLPAGALPEIIRQLQHIKSRIRGMKYDEAAEAYRVKKITKILEPVRTLAAHIASRIRGWKYDLAAEQYYREKAKNGNHIKGPGSTGTRLERETGGHADRLESEAPERSRAFEGQREERQDARPYPFGPTL